jgi:hypothetical protein
MLSTKIFDTILESHPKVEFPCFPQINEAVIGVTDDLRLIYSEDKCIRIFMRDENWPYEDALEWFWNNVECCYIGERTPKFTDEFDEVM